MAAPLLDHVALFHADFPDDPLKRIIRTIFKAYADAAESSKSFSPEERHDLLPQLRRALIERNVRFVGERFKKDGVTVRPCQNAGNNHYHNRIESGRVVLTVHKVDSPDEMVRDAVYRRGYAQSWQYDCLRPDEPPPPDTRLYGLLLHVPDDDYRNPPTSLVVRFPDEYCEQYVGFPIDLYKRFPEIDDQGRDDGTEFVNVPPVPRLRPVPDTGSGDE